MKLKVFFSVLFVVTAIAVFESCRNKKTVEVEAPAVEVVEEITAEDSLTIESVEELPAE